MSEGVTTEVGASGSSLIVGQRKSASSHASSSKNAAAHVRSAVVTASLSRLAGGIYYSARIPANMMSAAGWDISVFGLCDSDWETSRDGWRVGNINAYPPVGPPRFGACPAMLRDLTAGAFDLIHLRGLWSFPSAAVALTRKRQAVPTIISPEGMLDPWALRRSRIKKAVALTLFERRNLASATVLHALNEAEVRHMRAFGLKNAIAIIPNGVELPPSAAAIEGKPASKRTLLFLGRIHPKKGLRELIIAWDIATRRAPTLREQWRLDIAGWDDANTLESLRTLVSELALEDSVRFPGAMFGDAKDAALRNASAFILPSFGEGLPLGVLEAWAYSLPVFMTAQCNLSEGFRENAAIEIPACYNSTDCQQLAETIVYHLTIGTNDLAAVGARGRRTAEAQFTWEAVVVKYMKLYDWIVRGGTAPEFVFYP